MMEATPPTKSELFCWNDGRRIVDLGELSKQLHCKQCSSLLDLQHTQKEARFGLASVLYIHCTCGVVNDVHTGRTQKESTAKSSPDPMFEVNIKASINLLLYGAGASRILNFLALLDIPVPPADDTSLIMPVPEDAQFSNAPPSSPPNTLAVSTTNSSAFTTQTMSTCAQPTMSLSVPETSSFQKDELLSSNQSDRLPLSLPHTAAPDEDDSADALFEADSEDVELAVSDNRNQHESEEGENDIGDEINDKEDEYVPHTRLKRKLEITPPSSSRSNKKEKGDNLRSPTRGRRKQAEKAPEPEKLRTPSKRIRKLTIKMNSLERNAFLKSVKPKRGRPKSNSKDSSEAMDVLSDESENEPVKRKRKQRVKTDGSWSDEEDVEEEETSEEEIETPREKRIREKKEEEREMARQKRIHEKLEAKKLQKEEAKKQKEIEKQLKKVRPPSCDPTLKDRKVSTAKNPRLEGEAKDMPKCTTCAKDFNSIKGYNVHMKRVHNQDMKEHVEPIDIDLKISIFVCNFCHQPYARYHGVISHIQHKHWTPNIKPKDNYTMIPLKDAINEKQAKKGERKTRFSCLCCGRSGMSRTAITGHICVNTEGRVTCLTRFPGGKTLIKNDRRLLFYADKRCLLCPTCGAMFSERLNLDSHLMKEHGIVTERHKKHHCKVCDKVFSRKSGLDIHNSRVHAAEGQKTNSFICDFCGKSFSSMNSLYCHRKYSHLVGRGFQCQFCSKKFFKRHLWITHTKRHMGEKPYQCEVCHKDFTCNSNLMTHMRIHTGLRPYKCPACDADFIQRSSLVVHLTRHHPSVEVPQTSIVGANMNRSTVSHSVDGESNIGAETSSTLSAGRSGSAFVQSKGIVSVPGDMHRLPASAENHSDPQSVGLKVFE